MLKKILKKIFHTFGLEISRIDKEIKNVNFEELLSEKIKTNPIIFDVGGNKGQSIELFKKIFKNPTIHSFEPIKSEFDNLKRKFGSDKNIFLNNIALGDKIEEKELNITTLSGNSSFNEINRNTKWLKVRSKQHNTSTDNYVTSREKVKILTLDEYCKNKEIKEIDLLKLDTQGYEDKILKGSLVSLQTNKIKAIRTEIMFDNTYEKYLTFSDIEKYLLPNNFRMVGIDLMNNNLFTGLVFFADVYYFNKKFFKL